MKNDDPATLDPASLDVMLDVLADRTRRRLLDRLQADGQLSVDRIATELADGSEPRTNDGAIIDERERIEVSLRQVHLPKLADAGVIDWNPESGRIDVNGNTEIATELLAI